MEHVVNDAQYGIALKLGIDQHAQRVKIVYLVEAFVLLEHLAVDAVYRLYSAVEREVYPVFGQLVRYLTARTLDKIMALSVLFFDMLFYLFIAERVKVAQRDVLQLLLHPLHTETVCERRVYLHRFERGLPLLFRLFCAEGTHIVETVAQLDEYNADIARHGKKHLAQVLDMLLFLILERDVHQFGKSVDKHRNITAELGFYLLKAHLAAAVLHRIVQQRRTDGIGIKAERDRYLRDRYRVKNIFFTARAKLSLVQLCGIEIGTLYLFDVVLFARCRQSEQQHLYILIFKVIWYCVL